MWGKFCRLKCMQKTHHPIKKKEATWHENHEDKRYNKNYFKVIYKAYSLIEVYSKTWKREVCFATKKIFLRWKPRV